MMSGEEFLVEQYGEPGPPPRSRDELGLLLQGQFPFYERDPHISGQVVIDPDWLRENMVMEWFPLFDYVKPKQCGIFVPRFIGWNARRTLSFHSLGLAADINWNENPYGSHGTIRGTGIPEVLKRHGFTWGGDWSTPDDMHIQWGHKTITIPRS